MTSTTGRKPKRAHRYSGLPEPERVRARRQDVIRAGMQLFGTIGFADVGVRDICAEADLSTRYFYESFEDLEQLALVVAQQALQDIAVPAALAAFTTADPELRLKRGISAATDLLERDPRPGRVVFIETARAGGALAKWRYDLIDTLAPLASSALDGVDAIGPELLLQAWSPGPSTGPATPAGESNPYVVMAVGAFTEVVAAWLQGRINLTARELTELLHRSALDMFRAARLLH